MADLISAMDVGWSSSYTTFVTVQRYAVAPEHKGATQPDYEFHVHHLSRFPHGTSPRDVIEAVPPLIEQYKRLAVPSAAARAAPLREKAKEVAELARAARSPKQRHELSLQSKHLHALAKWTAEIRCHLAVDASNDRSFVDRLPPEDQLGARLRPIVITAGSTEAHEPERSRVSRNRLISYLYEVFQFRRLVVRDTVRDKDALGTELQSLSTHITAARNLTFRTRAGMNDDLVMSLAMAVWLGKELPGPPRSGVVINVDPGVAREWSRLSLLE